MFILHSTVDKKARSCQALLGKKGYAVTKPCPLCLSLREHTARHTASAGAMPPSEQLAIVT